MKPRITRTLPTDNGPHYFITFENGQAGECWQFNLNEWLWTLDDEDSPRGRAWDCATAFEGMTVSAHMAGGFELNPVEMTPEQAQTYEGLDCVGYTKALRRVLKQRTGRTWSVKVGKGTAYSWIHVQAPPARMVSWSQTPEDSAMLGVVIGESDSQGYSIPPTRGYRAALLYRAATGRTGEIECAEHGWD